MAGRLEHYHHYVRSQELDRQQEDSALNIYEAEATRSFDKETALAYYDHFKMMDSLDHVGTQKIPLGLIETAVMLKNVVSPPPPRRWSEDTEEYSYRDISQGFALMAAIWGKVPHVPDTDQLKALVRFMTSSDFDPKQTYIYNPASDAYELAPPEPDPYEKIVSTIKKRSPDILPVQHVSILLMRLQNDKITNADIAKELGLSPLTVKSLLSLARIQIEEHILSELGLKRITSYPLKDSMVTQASKGKLPGAYKILGIWYITDAAATEYLERARVLDKEMLNQGYIVLVDNTTPAEYAAIKDNLTFKKYRKKKNNRLYITVEHLNTAKQLVHASEGEKRGHNRGTNGQWISLEEKVIL
jgi:hypothetical protein